jgi:hypothetical protein
MMTEPRSAGDQLLVLLADQNSFCSSYIAGALSAHGMRVLGPFASEAELRQWFTSPAELPSAAIVAVDWLKEAHQEVLDQLGSCNIPAILLQNAPWLDTTGIAVNMAWPYGSFQVIKALQKLLTQKQP